MDQGKSVRTVAVIIVLMLLYTGQASASFKHCYADCIENCFAAAKERVYCTIKCFAKCLKADEVYGLNSCSYGCAIDQCPQFGDDVDKVDGCVKKCGSSKCNN